MSLIERSNKFKVWNCLLQFAFFELQSLGDLNNKLPAEVKTERGFVFIDYLSIKV